MNFVIFVILVEKCVKAVRGLHMCVYVGALGQKMIYNMWKKKKHISEEMDVWTDGWQVNISVAASISQKWFGLFLLTVPEGRTAQLILSESSRPPPA